jgi:hypothetical protein
MTDLSKDAPIRHAGPLVTHKWIMDTSSAQHVYKGQPMIIDQDVDTLYVRGYVDATTVAATDVCVGIAMEEKEVAASAAETTEIVVAVGPSIIGFKSTVFDNADLGKTVYMSDSGTLSETAGDNPQIGKLVAVEGGYAFVELTTPQICTGA